MGDGDERWGWVADPVAIGLVAGLLVAVHVVVPPGVREGFGLAYAGPDPLHALSAAYVHLTDAHLRGNVVGFVTAGGIAAWLAHLAGQRQWFRHAFGWYLTALPIAVGMTAAALVDAGVVARGFSGVVAGFVGFVLVSPGVVFHRGFGYPPWVGWTTVGILVVIVAGAIVYVQRGAIPPSIGGLLALGLVLTAGSLVWRVEDPVAGLRESDPRRRFIAATLTAIVVLAVVSVFVVGLFPADIVGDDSVTNLLAHYLGLVYGAVIAAWGSRYWTTPPHRSNRRS
jgi:hypothetical protein